MSTEPKVYVRDDGTGLLRVGESRVPLDGVLAGWREGQSPEAFQESYPDLSLEEVHGAIAYILGHPEEMGAYWHRQLRDWGAGQASSESENADYLRRIRASRSARIGELDSSSGF